MSAIQIPFLQQRFPTGLNKTVNNSRNEIRASTNKLSWIASVKLGNQITEEITKIGMPGVHKKVPG